ncbi:MAG TPA: UbiA family prenyltransferase [Rhizomicrobium sp.]|nr:UbiA family prenyltransferase [Rhizomicrobium sp.]
MQPIPEETPGAEILSELYIDIDGTLLRTDLLHEAAWQYVKFAPWRALQLLAVLMLRGRAALKSYLARKVCIDPARLPYEIGLIEYLKIQRDQGRPVVLITASHWRYARQIARHVGLSSASYGSSCRLNLKGSAKLAKIQALSAGKPFVYAGNAPADRTIWNAAHKAILVNAPHSDVRKENRSGHAELVIDSRPGAWRAFARGMRVHQWAKNALLLVPLLTSHSYTDVHRTALALLAFLVFGLCASGHYFLNDLLDLASDRGHTTKRRRPLASGDLALPYGIAGAAILPALAFAISLAALPWLFTLALAGYFALTNLYSFYLKRVSTADVVTLALLYTIRVVAGAAAITVVLSSWLLAFSVFMFVSLAYLKRYIEVSALMKGSKAAGRGYSEDDAETMFVLGIANSTAATVVLAFYISSSEVKALYHRPDVLWLLCLLMLYWSNRIWIGTRRGKINEDPVVFAMKDKVSRLVGLVAVAVVIAARLLP